MSNKQNKQNKQKTSTSSKTNDDKQNVIDAQNVEKQKQNDEQTRERIRKSNIVILLKQLNNVLPRNEKCRLRGQLRKHGHFGGLRNRTYIDKSDGNKTIIVNKIKTIVEIDDKKTNVETTKK